MLQKTKCQSKLLSISLPGLKQKFKILNTVIEPRIAYAYYGVSFSKRNIKILDKIISKLKENLQHTQKHCEHHHTSPPRRFGINITSLLSDYINCMGQQLIQALNDLEQLGTIYQGLAKYISAKYRGSLHLSEIKQQVCIRSPVA